jgi:hypothetical protein
MQRGVMLQGNPKQIANSSAQKRRGVTLGRVSDFLVYPTAGHAVPSVVSGHFRIDARLTHNTVKRAN